MQATNMQSMTRKVSLTRDEFLRELPDAIGGASFRIEGNTVLVEPARGQVARIQLTELGIERKGQLGLPMQRVDFQFDGMSDADIAQFLETWDAHKLRMGG